AGGQPEEPVLAPAVGAAARVVVGEVVPGGAVGRVVLAHRAPLALGQVRPPALPVAFTASVLLEAALLRCLRVFSHGARAFPGSGPASSRGGPGPGSLAAESRGRDARRRTSVWPRCWRGPACSAGLG